MRYRLMILTTVSILFAVWLPGPALVSAQGGGYLVQPYDPNLSLFATLLPQAGYIPYWPTATTMDMIHSTTYGRSLIACADADNLRPALRLGSISVKDAPYLAKGDGTTDDTAALQAAITAAVDANEPLLLPPGCYRFTSTLHFSLPIKVTGAGMPYSILWANVGTDANAIEVGGKSYGGRNGWICRDFSLLGATGSCKNGMIMTRLGDAHFENICVFCGTAAGGYGMVFDSCIYGDFENLDLRQNPTYPDHYRSTATLSANGVKLVRSTTQTQANRFHIHIGGQTGNGFYIDDQNGGGDNEITGTIENCTGYSFYAKNCRGLSVHDLHIESGSVCKLDGCSRSQLGPAFKNDTTDANTAIVSCSNTKIDGTSLYAVNVYSSSTSTVFSNVRWEAGSWIDRGTGTVYQGPILAATAPNNQMQAGPYHDKENLLTNTWLEDWREGDRPYGWSKPGTVTWTKTGLGLADAKARFGRYAGKAVITDTSPVVFNVPSDPRYSGQYVTFSVWTYTPTQTMTEGPIVELRVGSNDFSASGSPSAARDKWVQSTICALVPVGQEGNIKLRIGERALTSGFYMSGPCLFVGQHGTSGFVSGAGDLQGDCSTNGSFNSRAAQTVVNGSTSGSAVFSQPFQGPSYKKVVIYLNSLNGTASYSFPFAFTNTPAVVSTNGLATTKVTSLTTSSCTVTGGTDTGFLFIEGY